MPVLSDIIIKMFLIILDEVYIQGAGVHLKQALGFRDIAVHAVEDLFGREPDKMICLA